MAEISDYLQGLDEQKVQEAKQIVVVNNPVLDLICKEYETWLAKIQIGRSVHLIQGDDEKSYNYAIKSVRKISFTATDVNLFSIMLQKYQDDAFFSYSGLFLSAMINLSQENNFEVFTSHLEKELFDIGYKLGRGSVTILGNGHGCAKKMCGGSLSVSGNADFGGILMVQGRLTVKGDLFHAGPIIGGEVYVSGKKCTVIHPIDSTARIYHKEKLKWGRRKDES